MFELYGLDFSLEKFEIKSVDDTHEILLKIILFHAFLYIKQNKHIMDTIILVYEDNSLEIQSPFDTSIRTTAYRKINETADFVITSKERIKAVIVINEMWSYPNKEEVLRKNYKERVLTENPVSLFACHMVDSSLNTYSYHFESDKVDSSAYVIDILNEDVDTSIHLNFMNPIMVAFQSLHEQSH